MSTKLATYIQPMLAREVREPFSDEHWIYEVKWNGYRAIAELKGDDVRLYSRSGEIFNDAYPTLVEALKSLNLHGVLDGEIVAVDQTGRSDIRLLEQYDGGQSSLRFQVFDLLYKDGHCLEDQPLLWRKQLLKMILRTGDLVRYNDHVRGNGIAFFQEARDSAQEGIMGKRVDSIYVEGQRSSDWLKIKTYQEDEAIIIGYTLAGKTLGELILARYEGDNLRIAGRVHKGLNADWIELLERKMRPLVRKTSPLKGDDVPGGAVTWLRPVLVCAIRFTELNGEGVFRRAVFLGLRGEARR